MFYAVWGILLHAVGAACASSCFVSGKFIKRWEWDVYWFCFVSVGWLLLPVIVALFTIPDIVTVLSSVQPSTIAYTLLFGFIYGFGGYAFLLAIRQIGFSMTYCISIGCSATLGTIIPPLFLGGETLERMLHTSLGLYIAVALIVGVVGMYLVGRAGYRYERVGAKKPGESGDPSLIVKGFAVAVFAGVLSACYGFALHAGQPIAAAAEAAGASSLLKNNIVFIFANGGAFICNVFISFFLIYRLRAFREFIAGDRKPLVINYLLAVLGGGLWYFQFFFYGFAEHYMGIFSAASWAIHMIMLIIFAQFWGVFFKEWKGADANVMKSLRLGLLALTASVLIVAYGNAFS
ncbi:hypothetical protein BC443_16780 [Salinicola sp. MIT1003]|nr:hypothetical protein BC443_16780 [Salinicola sp. MIT1003]